MKRHALFVGVNTYDDKSIRKLRYSISDASVLADRFRGLGYKARILSDPTGSELKSAVVESINGLGHGDVFLFFFAGHGFTAQDGTHLLFCRDDMQQLLRVNSAGVRVNALEALTEGGGFHRAFLLDSCRTDCFAGMEGRGDVTRDLDIVAVPECTEESGSYFLLRSCDKFRPSLELDGIGHGLFTRALLDAMDARDGRLARCDTSFAAAVGAKMADIQRSYNVNVPQRPSMGECSGPVFSLFENGFLVPAEQIAHTVASAPASVMCPICGRHNFITDTFKCRVCGKDHLCGAHFSGEHNCCKECVAAKQTHIRSQTKSAIDAFAKNNHREAFASAQEADLTDAVIQYIIGCGFRYGYDFGDNIVSVRPIDKDGESLKWFQKAAEQGHVRAQYEMGNRHEQVSNYKDAVKWYRMAAEQGDAESQRRLGCLYYNGRGVGQDYLEAVRWTRRAAEQGDAIAQGNLGYSYAMGHGVCQDYAEAERWYGKSADQSASGHGQYNLGNKYFRGECVRQDYAEAEKWYRKAAELGYSPAQWQLAHMYEEGKGVVSNYTEAAKWYRMAAGNGHAFSQYCLGSMYENGKGVPRNYIEAVKWYSMAAEHGDEAAKLALGRIKRKIAEDEGAVAKRTLEPAKSGADQVLVSRHSVARGGRG